MQHWSQLGIRNWRVKPGRTAGALAAIALGVGVVIWVTCAYESVRLALRDQVWFWIGRSHLSVESVYGAEGTVFQSIADDLKDLTITVVDPEAKAQAEANDDEGNDDNGNAQSKRARQAAHRRKIQPIESITYRLKRVMVMHKVTGGPGPGRPGTQKDDRPPPGSAGREPPATNAAEFAPGPLASSSVDHDAMPFGIEVQAIGIVPELEAKFRDYGRERISGRMLTVQDDDAALIDRLLASKYDIEIGDRIRLRAASLGPEDEPSEQSAVFTVIGLLEHRRIAKQQRPAVLTQLGRIQALTGYDREPKRVTRIDVILKDTSRDVLRKTEWQMNKIVRKYRQGFLVTSARGKLAQVQAAEQQTGFVMLVISTVALFTAFFIILSTLSMGMVERIGEFGTLRCLGATRLQLALMVLGEAVPLGLLGIVLGIPVGLALGQLSILIAPEFVGKFAINQTGLTLALVGGAVTVVAGALLPMFQAMRISPLAAARAHARPAPGILAWIAAVLGLGMIFGHTWMVENLKPILWFNPNYTLPGVAMLYAGYAFIVPALVRVLGALAVWLIALTLRVRYRLLSDQVGRAVWRSSAICCGLMVGLSLIVTLAVQSESMVAGWNFPKDFCEAFVYVVPPVDYHVADEARDLPGVAESCLVNTSLRCTIIGKGYFNFPFSLFVAGDPDEFFKIAKLEFVEGNQEDAIAKLKKGGYILVTPEFVRSKKIGYGETAVIREVAVFGRRKRFEIAGVVTSPALHIAANYFNAGDMLVSQSVHVVLGTIDDAKDIFRVPNEVSLLLTNFDLPETAAPEAFDAAGLPPWRDPATFAEHLLTWRDALPQRAGELDAIEAELTQARQAQGQPSWSAMPTTRLFRNAMALDVGPVWHKRNATERWQTYREALVMRLIAHRSGSETYQYASVRALKLQIDRDLRRATALFAAIPLVALVVAALGVGNLMMANVTNRTREIAMLRAVGATRWQITRLVIGEALVLGALGCAVGIKLGTHAAASMFHLIEQIWGFRPVWTLPYSWLAAALAFTLGICLVAGILPARRAARNNIIDALQTT